uniref:Uncharacterized protein n=1 Tax=Heterorhabditis bacteriophora TaxID=37862 RepID=A0A1I7WLP8_HETBA
MDLNTASFCLQQITERGSVVGPDPLRYSSWKRMINTIIIMITFIRNINPIYIPRSDPAQYEGSSPGVDGHQSLLFCRRSISTTRRIHGTLQEIRICSMTRSEFHMLGTHGLQRNAPIDTPQTTLDSETQLRLLQSIILTDCFQRTDECNVPSNRLVHTIQLFDLTKFRVTSLDLIFKQTENTSARWFGSGEVTGITDYCARFLCNTMGTRFCTTPHLEIANIRTPTSQVPILAWSANVITVL